MPKVRLLLVDDSQEFLDSIHRLLALYPDLEVVGAALSGVQALALVPRLRPDLVVLDLAMPGMNGLETARRLKGLIPAPRIIILTLHDDPAYEQAALAVGADGFVSKATLGRQLFPRIAALFPSPPCPPALPAEGSRGLSS
jgi:DNA-binding NarL/FixJ family response regulator